MATEQRDRVRPGVHEYERDPASFDWHCWCGRPLENRLHPHRFVRRSEDPERCMCGAGVLGGNHIREEVPHA